MSWPSEYDALHALDRLVGLGDLATDRDMIDTEDICRRADLRNGFGPPSPALPAPPSAPRHTYFEALLALERLNMCGGKEAPPELREWAPHAARDALGMAQNEGHSVALEVRGHD